MDRRNNANSNKREAEDTLPGTFYPSPVSCTVLADGLATGLKNKHDANNRAEAKA